MEIEALRSINLLIGTKEDEADREWFDGLLAPVFVMRRRTGLIVDRASFLDSLKKNEGDRRVTTLEAIELIGDSRAIVRCTMTMGAMVTHNLRVFCFSDELKKWLFLAWINEPLS